jgi:hypothetical protein
MGISSRPRPVAPVPSRAAPVRKTAVGLVGKEPVVVDPVVVDPMVDFGEAARSSMLHLRLATAGVISAIGDLDRPVRLAERLTIDRSLAWKVWKVAFGPSALPSAAHVPGRIGYRRFVEAAGAVGVEPGILAEAQTAFDRLGEVMTTHGGDRASGAIMLSSISGAGRMRTELTMRRAAFRANCHFLGVQASTLYQLDVLLPSAPGTRPTVVRYRSFIGLRRTRPDVSWLLGRSTPVAADGPLAGAVRSPLVAPEGGTDSPWLVPQFCSTPMPAVVRRTVGGVTVEDELAPGDVGIRGEVDVAMAERISGVPWRDGPRHAVVMKVNTPCQAAVHEVLVAPGVTQGGVRLRVHSMVHSELPYLRGEDADLIPVPEDFVNCGHPGECAPVPEVPWHRAILSWMLGQCGLDAEPEQGARAVQSELGAQRVEAGPTLYRAAVKFPPVPACLAAVMDLRSFVGH